MYKSTGLQILLSVLVSVLAGDAGITLCAATAVEVEETGSLPQPAARIINEPESVWVEFVELAAKEKPLNLGQGFPDFAPPEYLVKALGEATDIQNSSQVLNHQYTRSFGHPRLVKALRRYYHDFRWFTNLRDPNEQVLITVGAYEALFVSIMAFVDEGDEVIIIEPAFDAYAPMVAMAKGRSIHLPLKLTLKNGTESNQRITSADYKLDMDEFKSAITNRTKLLVLNTPNNPLGKIYSRSELEAIANLCRQHNILVLADEVYDQIYYPPEVHLSIARFVGMWNRTITVGSVGKTFSVTGWKLGWALGPQHLIKYLQLVHQTAVYTVPTPLQEATARTLEHQMDLKASGKPTYWDSLRSDMLEKRTRISQVLERAKMKPIVPQGGYFMVANFEDYAKAYTGDYYSQLGCPSRANGSLSNDYRFARWLSRAKKVQGIPGSAFFSTNLKHLGKNQIRFSFIKQTSTFDKLEQLLANKTSQVGPSFPEPCLQTP